MKTALTISGRVELTHEEVSTAIFEYLAKLGYKGQKVIYLPSEEKFKGAVIHVGESSLAEIKEINPVKQKEVKEFPDEKLIEKRQSSSGYTIKNRGVNDSIRAFLNQAWERKDQNQKIATVSFKELLSEIIFLHPGMDQQKLYIYLYDRRQIPNIEYHPKEGRITVLGTIDHRK